MVVIDGRLADDPKWRPAPRPATPFETVTIPQAVEIIEGAVMCDDVPATDGQRLDVHFGMRRRCVVGVPPVPDVFVGILVIAWREPPDPKTEPGFRAELRRLALKLATW